MGVTHFKFDDGSSPCIPEPDETPEPDDTVDFVEPKKLDEKIVAALNDAANFYNDFLMSNEDRFKHIWDYLARRGVGKDTISKFNIGYAPPYSDEGHQGRALTAGFFPRPDDRGVRWLKHQTREDPLSARGWLYGIEKAVRYIRQYRTIILVEGIFDYFAFNEFSRMKEGVILINTSRGDVLDIKALAKANGEGKVAAAGLDVLPEEGDIREEAELLRSVYDKKHDLETMLLNHILLRLRNVIITPHSAFNTREAVERILSTTVGNIASFTRGEYENVIPDERM